MVTALAGLETGTITPKTKINDTGVFRNTIALGNAGIDMDMDI